MSNPAEVLHDRPTDDPHAWQPIASLARSLRIAERTVRHRAASGMLERLRTPDGHTYYRQPIGQSVSADEGTATPLAVARMASEHARELAAATRELVEARASAAAATATQLATVQRLEDERQRAQRLEDERQRLEHERQRLTDDLRQERQRLEDERQRLEVFARLATAPWYAFRVRRQLRRQLVAMASPSGGEPTGEPGAASSV